MTHAGNTAGHQLGCGPQGITSARQSPEHPAARIQHPFAVYQLGAVKTVDAGMSHCQGY